MAQKLIEQFITSLHRLERNRGDLDPLVSLFSEQAELQNLATPWPLQGRAGTLRFWRDYMSAFQSVETRFTRIQDFDEAATLEWTSSGNLPSGKPMSYRGVTLLEFEDGRIVRLRSYYDSAVFIPQGAKHRAA